MCPRCKVEGVTHSEYAFDLKTRLAVALQRISNFEEKPIKGVRGLTSESKTCETVEKGILRSKHDVYVYKDGTIRIDVTNAPLTHFRIKDVQVDLETLKGLGYETDIHGDKVQSSEQIVELKPQDIVIPTNVADDLLRIANFVDEELQSIFHLRPAYNASDVTHLIGRKVMGLAPHTSVGVIGRIVGFTNAQVCYANPCWHAAKRRDCDGDGDSILLLLDVLLNFSVEYLPDQIGGLMDTPLLIQPIILPSEVDDQAHNFDVAWMYPSKFYEVASTSSNPTIATSFMETIGSRLDDEKQFYAYGFTNDTSTIRIKRSRSAYSTLNTLNEKVSKQIEVAQRIKAVEPKEVVESIIKTHLVRDIIGNMKKYATQSFKCRKCGKTFRRPSVSGRCNSCGEELHETLTKGSVEKYFPLARRLATAFDVDEYTKSRLELIEKELDQLFIGRDKSTQLEMTDFA
jgi:DNA polymerase II large subunit